MYVHTHRQSKKPNKPKKWEKEMVKRTGLEHFPDASDDVIKNPPRTTSR